MDAVIADDLGRDTGVKLDAQLVSGSGTSGQLRGLANISGILTFATSATTAQGQLSAIWDGFNRLAGSSGFGNPDPADYFLIMHASPPLRLALGAARGERASRRLPTSPATSSSPEGFAPTSERGRTRTRSSSRRSRTSYS